MRKIILANASIRQKRCAILLKIIKRKQCLLVLANSRRKKVSENNDFSEFHSAANKKMNTKMGIFTLFLSIAVLISVLFFGGVFFFHATKSYEVDAGISLLNNIAHPFEDFLTEAMDALAVVAQDSEAFIFSRKTHSLEGFLREKSMALTAFKQNSTLKGTFYGYINGKCVNTEYGNDAEDAVWYKKSRAANGKAVTVLQRVGKSQRLVLTAAKELSDGVSVLAFDVELDDITETLSRFYLGKNAWCVLVNRDSTAVCTIGDSAVAAGKNGDEYSLRDNVRMILGAVYKGLSGIFDTKISGTDCTVFHKCLQGEYFFVLIFKQTELFYRIRGKMVLKIIIFLAHIMFIVLFYVSNLLNRRKSNSYAQLLEQNQSVINDYRDLLEEKVREQTEIIKNKTHDLIKLQENVIENLATMIESRDECTGEHVRNTKIYAIMLSEHLFAKGLFKDEIDEEFISLMGDASLLHDIGKIKISDVILNKKDALSDEEFEIMKMHTVFGREIAGKILAESGNKRLIAMAENVANYHHERFDGLGYPDGLIGSEIPLPARIMAVVDVFDALVAKRSYKFSLNAESAFNIIAKGAGTHFDPVLVASFLEIRPQIESFLHSR